jgi:ferric-dicitrate binding protein FerR (iron transport regulator)
VDVQAVMKKIKQKVMDAGRQFGEHCRVFADAVSGRVKTWSGSKTASAHSVRRIDSPGSIQPSKANTRFLSQKRKTKKIPRIRRRSRQRVYRLQGYTTVSKINSRRKSERRQRLLRQLLLILMIILFLILLFYLYNPIRDLAEWYRIIGIRDIAELAGQTEGSISPTP